MYLSVIINKQDNRKDYRCLLAADNELYRFRNVAFKNLMQSLYRFSRK